MRVIGLTGGIASGKSTVSAWLRQWGAHIVDADAISRETTKQGGRGYRAVVARFGREILRPDGELDRRKLGGIVFADEDRRRELEGILHPIVIEESKAEMARAAAQGCADAMVRGGVKAIWNFAPVHLSAPPGVLVQRENMASSLALLSYHLKRAEEGLPDEQA